jgi:hypothetical protein
VPRLPPTSLVLLLCGLKLLAQDGAQSAIQTAGVRIEGTVIDARTEIPLPGARVTLHYATSPAPLDAAVTQAPGTFRFSISQPGNYAIEAEAPGFLNAVYPGAGSGIEIGDTEFEPQADAMVHSIVVKMSGAGILTGHVQDADSKDPMALVTVRALRFWWLRGKRQLTEEAIIFTDREGQFRFDSLAPGEYLVEVQKITPSSAAQEAGGKRYPIVMWPGADPDHVDAFTVLPGGDTDTGTISYSTIALPRVRGTIANCPPGHGYYIVLHQRIGGAFLKRDTLAPSECGAPFSIPALSPDDYRLLVLSLTPANGPGEPPALKLTSGSATGPWGLGPQALRFATGLLIGAAEIHATEGADLDLQAKLLDPAGIRGRVICECEKALAAADERMRIQLLPLEDNGVATQIEVREDGTFADLAAFVGSGGLVLQNLRQGLYVKQIAVSGAESGPFLNAIPGSAASIEITLSDSPAAVNGTVVQDGKTIAGEYVVLAAWPLRLVDGYPEYMSAQTGGKGEFAIGNVAPGKYRIVNAGPGEWAQKDIPGAIAQWLAAGEEVTVVEKETKNVRLEEKP